MLATECYGGKTTVLWHGPLHLTSSDLGARRHTPPRRRCCWLDSRLCGGATSARPCLIYSSQGSAIRQSVRERGATSTRSSRTPQPGCAPLGLRSFTSMSPDHLRPATTHDRTRATCKSSRHVRSAWTHRKQNPIQPGRGVPVERSDPEWQERRSVSRPRMQEDRTAR